MSTRALLGCFTILALGATLLGCPKKDEGVAADSAAPTAAASASSVPTAAASASATTATPETAETAMMPPTGAPEVVEDPNTPPTHDDHDKAATATIQKANYKGELDKLEKEDLNSTK